VTEDTTGTTQERTADVLALWRHVFAGAGDVSGKRLCIFSGEWDRDAGELTEESLQTHFRTFGSGSRSAARLVLRLSEVGRETYFCTHLLRADRRVKANADEVVRTLWIDGDDAPLPLEGVLRPTACVKSSANRWQGYYRLTKPIPTERAVELNQRLTDHLGGDRKHALATVLRAPGTTNRKRDPDGEPVVLGWIDEREVDPDELEQALPQPNANGRTRQKAHAGVFAGRKIKDGEGRRGYLLHQAGILRNMGLNTEQIDHTLQRLNLENLDPPKSEADVRKIAESMHNYEPDPQKVPRRPPVDHVDAVDAVDAVPKSGFRELPAAAAFPGGALPAVLSRFVSEAATAIGCPPDLVALPALAAAGASIGNSRVISPKAGWSEGATLYGAVIADSGERKSAAVAAALKPLRKIQRRMNRDYAEAAEDHAADMRAYKMDEKDRQKARDTSPPPTEPSPGYVVVDDATVEAMVPILNQNPRGVLQVKDEVVALIKGFNAYRGGAGGDRQFYLSGWSNLPVSVQRKNQPPLAVHRPFFGVIGSIQPTVLPQLAGEDEDGMLERFLVAYPDPINAPWTDVELSQGAESAYSDLHEKLRSLSMRNDDMGDPMPVTVGFAADALELYKSAHDDHRAEMGAPWFQAHLRPAWSKLEAYLLRLTLICACCRFAVEGTAERIEVEDVVRAVKMVDYFKAHARRAHTVLKDEDPVRGLLEDVVAFLHQHGGAWEGEPTDLYKALPSRHKGKAPQALTGKLKRLAKSSPHLSFSAGSERPEGGGDPRRIVKIHFKE
jgi:hypothetical protein